MLFVGDKIYYSGFGMAGGDMVSCRSLSNLTLGSQALHPDSCPCRQSIIQTACPEEYRSASLRETVGGC